MRLAPLLCVLLALAMVVAVVMIVAMFDDARQRAAFAQRCVDDGGMILKAQDREVCLFFPEDTP